MKTMRWTVAAVCLIASLTPTGRAEAADLGWHGLELRGGVTFPADWDNGYTVAAAADLGEITDGLRLFAGLSYAKADTSDSVNLLGIRFMVDQEITDLALGAEVRYFFAGEPRGWYVGGGPYLHRQEYEQVVILGNVATAAAVETDSIGIEGVAGYSFGGRFGLEARYDTVSNFKGFQLLASIRFGG
jgi:hypothetical protein